MMKRSSKITLFLFIALDSLIISFSRLVYFNYRCSIDADGDTFFSFAIDPRYGIFGKKQIEEEGWNKGSIMGFSYPKTQKVWVDLGDKYYEASVLWGARAFVSPDHVYVARRNSRRSETSHYTY